VIGKVIPGDGQQAEIRGLQKIPKVYLVVQSIIPAVNAILLQLFSPSKFTQLTQAEHHFRACVLMGSSFLNLIKHLHTAMKQPRIIVLALRRSANRKESGKDISTCEHCKII